MYFEGDVRTLTPIPEQLIAPIKNQLLNHDDLWRKLDPFKPNRFKVFSGNTHHIIFQYPRSRDDHRDAIYFPIWKSWQALLNPVIDYIAQHYDYKKGKTSRIMLARLLAGQQCRPHIDHTPSADIPHKIHVPIQTHPDILFFEENRKYHLEYGHAYEVNNKIRHYAVNSSRIDRVHLIFDYYAT